MSETKKKIRDILGAPQNKQPVITGIEINAGRDIKEITVISKSKISISGASELIADEQAFRLRELVHEIAQLERKYSHNPASIAMVWVKLKDRLRVTSYKLMTVDQYAEALNFLADWKDQIRLDCHRDPDTLEDRAAMYRKCHAISKRYGLEKERLALMQGKWGVESMRDLADEQLEELLAFMRAIEAQYKNKP